MASNKKQKEQYKKKRYDTVIWWRELSKLKKKGLSLQVQTLLKLVSEIEHEIMWCVKSQKEQKQQQN